MILNLEQVQNITRGVSRVAEIDGKFNFYRFNEKQMDFYKEVSPRDFYVKAFSTASVCLDFYTDSKNFSFDYDVEHSTGRRFYYFDVFVDGILAKHLGEPNAWIKKGSISVALDDLGAPEWVKTNHKNYNPEKSGEHRVSLWLPNLSNAKLFNITLDDGASFRKAEPKKNILVYGDSITQGCGTTPNKYSHWNAFLSEMIGEEYSFWNFFETFGSNFIFSGSESKNSINSTSNRGYLNSTPLALPNLFPKYTHN
jgi:hypothetical protein